MRFAASATTLVRVRGRGDRPRRVPGVVTEPDATGAAAERMPSDEACLVRLSAAMAAGADAEVEAELRRARGRLDPRHVDETIVQSCLFLGFPAALEAAATWREMRGAAPVDEDPLAGPEHAVERAARGARLCRLVYGTAYEALRRNVGDANPALDRLMVETGYGAVLGRPGLDVLRRELCLVAVLAVQARDRQLHSHLRGALRAGAPVSWVEEALEIGVSLAPPPARDRLRTVWREVMARSEERERNPDVH